MADPPLLAGAAKSNITPPLGISINGGMSDRIAGHIHDELHARCLVLRRGDQFVVLVVCDSCMLPGGLIDEAKHQAHGHTGIALDQMLIAATHTHTAPTVAGVFQSEPDLPYAEFLISRIADGIRRAVNNLRPAKIGWGVGRVPQHVFNRRWRMKPGAIPPNPFGDEDRVRMNPPVASADLVEPAGPTDPELSIVAVQSLAGRPIAVLANYSLHYVGGTGPADISADYFGMFADLVERATEGDRDDPPAVAMMSNGTSGNINNIDFRTPRGRQEPYEQMRRVAHDVAQEAVRVYRRIELRDDVPLAIREARVTLARRLPTRGDVERARQILSRAGGPQLQVLEAVYAHETVRMADWPATKETVVQAVRIGDVGIATFPCETFVETGLAVREHSPLKQTFSVSLANDYAGYLPTVEHHGLGGYETWRARSSYLEVDAEPKLREKVLELLNRLAAEQG